MNKGIINIPEPCQKNFSEMKKCEGGFHCSLCNKKVHDLSKLSTQQVKEFNKTTDDVCVIVHARHEITTANNYNFINKTENVFLKHGFKRMAIISTTILLFISGCASRKHGRKMGAKFEPKIPAIENNISSDSAQ